MNSACRPGRCIANRQVPQLPEYLRNGQAPGCWRRHPADMLRAVPDTDRIPPLRAIGLQISQRECAGVELVTLNSGNDGIGNGTFTQRPCPCSATAIIVSASAGFLRTCPTGQALLFAS